MEVDSCFGILGATVVQASEQFLKDHPEIEMLRDFNVNMSEEWVKKNSSAYEALGKMLYSERALEVATTIPGIRDSAKFALRVDLIGKINTIARNIPKIEGFARDVGGAIVSGKASSFAKIDVSFADLANAVRFGIQAGVVIVAAMEWLEEMFGRKDDGDPFPENSRMMRAIVRGIRKYQLSVPFGVAGSKIRVSQIINEISDGLDIAEAKGLRDNYAATDSGLYGTGLVEAILYKHFSALKKPLTWAKDFYNGGGGSKEWRSEYVEYATGKWERLHGGSAFIPDDNWYHGSKERPSDNIQFFKSSYFLAALNEGYPGEAVLDTIEKIMFKSQYQDFQYAIHAKMADVILDGRGAMIDYTLDWTTRYCRSVVGKGLFVAENNTSGQVIGMGFQWMSYVRYNAMVAAFTENGMMDYLNSLISDDLAAAMAAAGDDPDTAFLEVDASKTTATEQIMNDISAELLTKLITRTPKRPPPPPSSSGSAAGLAIAAAALYALSQG